MKCPFKLSPFITSGKLFCILKVIYKRQQALISKPQQSMFFEQHACHLLMGNASKVTHNRLLFLCACSLQTSKPAGYGSSVADRKWERQIRECQINADGRQ